MQIKQDQLAENVLKLEVQVAPEDYKEKVEKELKDVRKRIQMPGFRSGQVPKSLIDKKYGKEVRYRHTMDAAIEQLHKHLNEQGLKRMGMVDVLSVTPEDFVSSEDTYTIVFSAGITPNFGITIDKNLTLPWKNIKVTDEEVDKSFQNFRASATTPKDVEKAAHERAIIYGTLKELNPEGEPLTNDKAAIFIDYVKDAEQKASLQAASKGDTLTFHPYKAFEGAVAELSGLLGVDRNDIAKYENTLFELHIERITEPVQRELSKELYAEAFGADKEGETEEDFRRAIRERMEMANEDVSLSLFEIDLHKYILERAGNVALPEEHLLMLINKNREEDGLDPVTALGEDQRKFIIIESIVSQIAETGSLEVTREELKEHYKGMYRQYFGGGSNEQIESLLDKLGEQRLSEMDGTSELAQDSYSLLSRKVNHYVKENVTLNVEEITSEEARAIFQEHNDAIAATDDDEEVGTYADADAQAEATKEEK